MSLGERAWYRVGAWGAALGFMGFIFWLTSRPSIHLPVWFQQQDKIYHFIEYHILAFLVAHAATQGSAKRRFWVAFSLAAVYAFTDEAHRQLLLGHGASFWNWLAGAAGAWAGAYLYLKSENVMRRSKR